MVRDQAFIHLTPTPSLNRLSQVISGACASFSCCNVESFVYTRAIKITVRVDISKRHESPEKSVFIQKIIIAGFSSSENSPAVF